MGQHEQNNPQQDSSKSYWVYGLIALVLFFFARNCSCSDDSSETDKTRTEHVTNNDTEYDKAPSWIIGEWECHSRYGLMRLKITSSTITEIMPEGEVTRSGYHMQENTLMTDGSSGTCYELDMINHRIAAGQGYFFNKVRWCLEPSGRDRTRSFITIWFVWNILKMHWFCFRW